MTLNIILSPHCISATLGVYFVLYRLPITLTFTLHFIYPERFLITCWWWPCIRFAIMNAFLYQYMAILVTSPLLTHNPWLWLCIAFHLKPKMAFFLHIFLLIHLHILTNLWLGIILGWISWNLTRALIIYDYEWINTNEVSINEWVVVYFNMAPNYSNICDI